MAKRELKVIPLGGLNEIGKNMTALEFGKEIILIDCGMTFPEEEMLGIDIVIPDFSYLVKNKAKVKSIVLTHGHEDHIGALPYFLKEINVPIYGTRLTLGLVERKLKEHQLDNVDLRCVSAGDTITIGSFDVDFIRVSHSIPDAVSLGIHTPLGTIVHTGDFKVDYTPIDGEVIDLKKFAQLGNQEVLLLMADSTNVERKGYTMSESTVGNTFDEIFRHADSRIIVASFASNIHRVQQIVNAAHYNGRKVAFSGRSMETVSGVAIDLGYLKIPEGMIIDINDIRRYPENEICVITTGSQGEPMAALSRMAHGEHRKMQIVPGDLVILSATPIPGNEKSVKRIIDLLFKRGAEVIYERLADVHVSGHACQEELKLIHTLVKPKYFVPVHGEYTHLKHHASLAETLGMYSEDIFILDNGSTLRFTEKEENGVKTIDVDSSMRVPSGQVLIDGLGVGDVGNIVLRDRKLLSEDGLIVVVATISKGTGRVIGKPDIISRGFVYVRESEQLINDAKEVIYNSLLASNDKGIREWSSLKSGIRDSLRQFIYQSTKRNPMILPIIMEVPEDEK